MFSFLTPYKLYIEIAVVLGLIAMIAYGSHRILQFERKLGYDKAVAEYTEKALIANQAARVKEQDLNNQVTEARNAAIKRDQELNKLASALNSANKRLRDTTTSIRNKLPQNSPLTVANTADAALTALGECADRYSEMARTADGYANEIRMLQEAWPK